MVAFRIDLGQSMADKEDDVLSLMKRSKIEAMRPLRSVNSIVVLPATYSFLSTGV